MKVNIGPYTDFDIDREIDIHIDKYDTWSMDHTLALIILPMLKQLKETKHGSSSVSDEDVPEHLRSTNASPKENEWDTDDLWHERWDWVLDEMIWAFEQIINYNNDSQFFTDNGKGWQTEKLETGDYRIVETGKDFDKEGWTTHNERINRGTTLFGKYYRGLWD
jgi:hypothetical protein